MKSYKLLATSLIVSLILLVSDHANGCSPSGKIRGIKAPAGQCNQDNGAECCVQGKLYPTFKCSPPVTRNTKAKLTLNSFQKGGDGGGPSKCDGIHHSDNTPVVALSTGWFNGGSRCSKKIKISGNGKTVFATVVDECDSTRGCDQEHGFQPPGDNNVVDASIAVWNALGLDQDEGVHPITWTDA